MKNIFKFLTYILFAILVIVIGVLVFFNANYNSANSELQAAQSNFPKNNKPFFQFEFDHNAESELSLLPTPKEYFWKNGQFDWPSNWEISSNIPTATEWVNRLLINSESAIKGAKIHFLYQESLSDEGYDLDINPTNIEIKYKTKSGAYYALVTLHHLQNQFPTTINCLTIKDEPDLRIRGLMHDISRDKVPQRHTLKELVDQLSMLKYNHLELYVEGFSFGYPSFKHLWQNTETPITPEEIQELDAYCKDRFIELVPNQNSLGHMQAWLETPEFENLAECPEGFEVMPMRKMKTTIDPSNPKSIELIKQMTQDLLPHFSSDKFNVNLDEPFELGHCNNKELADRIGVGQIYLNYVLEIFEIVKDHDKEFWMWGDIIGKHPELLDQLPNDITVLEWGYEKEHPFDENTARIKKRGLDFLVCPGTSSWMTLTGRTDNMLGNIENAILSGIKNSAKGMLLTDWGDMGHWQYLPVSFPGIAYAGAISWNSSTSRSLSLEKYLNVHMIEDKDQDIGNIVMEMGRSYHFEDRHLPNMSHNFMAYQFGISNPVLENTIYSAIKKKLPELAGADVVHRIQSRFENKKEFQIDELNNHLNSLEIRLNKNVNESNINQQSDNKKVIRNELKNGIQMVRLGAEIRNYSQQKEHWSPTERIEYLTIMQNRLEDIQDEHKRLWNLRNKPGGLTRSMESFKNLETQIINLIEIETEGGFNKTLNYYKEKIIAGGANWYLN